MNIINNDIVRDYLQTCYTSRRLLTKNLIIIVKTYFVATPVHKSKVAITTELLFLKFTLVLLLLSLTDLKHRHGCGHRLYRQQYLGLMVASTWICGFGALVATWLGKWGRFGLDPGIGSCSILPDQRGNSPKVRDTRSTQTLFYGLHLRSVIV